MIGAPFAHVGGLPIEETLGSLGPALLVTVSAAWASFAPACASRTLATEDPRRENSDELGADREVRPRDRPRPKRGRLSALGAWSRPGYARAGPRWTPSG